MIHILVADSSAIFRSTLKEIILKTKKLDLVGEVISFRELKSAIEKFKPNIIIATQAFFDADRISTLSDYCSTAEIPTIIFHEPGQERHLASKNVIFRVMPEFMNFSSEKITEYAYLLEQCIMDMKCNVLFENHPCTLLANAGSEASSPAPALKPLPKDLPAHNFKAVLVGVSTGGPGALLEFLKGIGRNFPLPIFITQHIDSFFDKNLIDWLATESKVPVELARNNAKPVEGHVYFAPSDEHLTFTQSLDDDFRMILNHDAPVNFLRPAVDQMFESAAKVIGKNCIAVVLTGMGADGAKECLHLKNIGAYTITQDEATSVIYGMPKAAYENGGSCEVLPLGQISDRLWDLVGVERI